MQGTRGAKYLLIMCVLKSTPHIGRGFRKRGITLEARDSVAETLQLSFAAAS